MTAPGTVAVTGITGLVGSAVARSFAAHGWLVRGLVRAETADGRGQEGFVGDITQPETLRGFCDEVDVVVHTAALAVDWASSSLFQRTNVEGTANVLKEARTAGVSRFVHVSTVDVFGFRKHTLMNEQSPKRPPAFPYSRTKLEAESLVWSYGRQGLPVCVVYPSWVFGPGDRHFVPEIVEGLRSKQLPYLGRHAHCELTYCDNLADAIVLVATSEQAEGEGYIVGDGFDLTFGAFNDMIAAAAGLRAPHFTLPTPVAYGAAAVSEIVAHLARSAKRPLLTRYAVEGLVRGMRYDLSKIESLGHKPSIGINEAVEPAVADAG